VASGSERWARWRPGSPGCFPGFFPDRLRRDFGAGFALPSDDGGFEELREFMSRRARNSAISAVSFSIRAACSATVVRNEETSSLSSS
jgi:hypothetical protein